jgi:hypothetical protein
MIRTIEVVYSELGPPPNPHDKNLAQAIGYLSLWGNANKVVLHIEEHLDVLAHYYRTNANTGEQQFFFTIGAIRGSDNTYTFHS